MNFKFLILTMLFLSNNLYSKSKVDAIPFIDYYNVGNNYNYNFNENLPFKKNKINTNKKNKTKFKQLGIYKKYTVFLKNKKDSKLKKKQALLLSKLHLTENRVYPTKRYS